MGKKALQLASVASMIDQFNIPNIKTLQSLGYSVDVVADFTNPGNITNERAENLNARLKNMEVRVFNIFIPRTLNFPAILRAYKEVKKLIDSEQYDIIHCHSPIGSVICRLAAINARKKGTKVIYTAHGFHFYDGAPLKNWIIYYPIEKVLSRFTDTIITINKEDYKRAFKNFKARKIVYIPGIGVDTKRFSPSQSGRERIRNELKIDPEKVMLLSVGELNENKNHSAVIRAISGMDIVYVIVGKGQLQKDLEQAAKEWKVDLRLMGFRTDVADFYSAADVYVLPSLREGLNVSLMEAMSSGLAVACGRIRGNTDLIDTSLFSPTNTDEIKKAISNSIINKQQYGKDNLKKIKAYDIEKVKELMSTIYKECDI